MEYVTAELVDRQGWPEIGEYRRKLRLDRGFRLSGYTVDETLTFEELAHSFLDQRRALDGKRLVGATVHNHFDELPRIWVNAKYIFLNRDPRDVARSCIQMGWAGTAWGGAATWMEAQQAWERLSKSAAKERIMQLQFESLIEQPEVELTRICQFLGTEFQSSMMEIEADTTYSRPNKSESKSWRDSAAPREVMQVEARVGSDALRHAGYVRSGLPTLRMSPLRRLLIHVEDVFIRARLRIGFYGLSLWSAAVVTRRLPFESLRESIQLKIDAIDNEQMK